MTHYNVGYMDNSHKHQEICVTATDSYDAKRIVCEDVPYIHDHPNSIDYVLGIKNERQIRQSSNDQQTDATQKRVGL